MKALSFEIEGRESFGIAEDDCIREASQTFRQRYSSLKAVLEADMLAELPENLEPLRIDAIDIGYLPVIPQPGKTICVGVNYRPHVLEMGRELPQYPVLFVRFPGSQVGHQQPIIKASVSEQYDFEGELAIVIGKASRFVDRADAKSVIAGYTCFMDGSVRDWQSHTHQFTAGKNFVQSGAVGPYLTTGDELPGMPGSAEYRDLELVTRVNGAIMQKERVAGLIFDIPALIAYCSTFTELLPGDIIATGTPGGVGAGRKPPRWLMPGDQVEVDLGPIGTLCNSVRAG